MRPAEDRTDDQHTDLHAAPVTTDADGAAAQPSHPRPVPGAGGVVFDPQGRVLVLLHANGDRVFPKGHLEGAETPLEAALREVQEESGISASCPEPQRSWTTTYRNSRGVPREVTWFACVTSDPTPRLTEELFQEAHFLPPDRALAQLTFAADRQLLSRILAEGTPVVRQRSSTRTPDSNPPRTGNGAS